MSRVHAVATYLALFCVPLCAQKLGEGSHVKIVDDLVHANGFPVWNNGRLLSLSNDQTAAPVIRAIDETGYVRETRVITIPESVRILIQAFGRQPDGDIVAAGFTWTAEGKESTFLTIAPADGSAQHTLTLSPYTPYALTVSPDGTIWTAGLEMVNRNEKNPAISPHYLMLRSYDRTGRFLKGYVPRSSLPPTAVNDISLSRLSANHNSVAWLLSDQVFLLTPSGEMQVRTIPEFDRTAYATMALTDNDQFVIAGANRNCVVCTLLNDRLVPMQLPGPLAKTKFTVVYGAEGNTVAVYERQDGFFYAHFLPVLTETAVSSGK